MVEPKEAVGLILGMSLLMLLSSAAHAELLVSGAVRAEPVTVGDKFSDDHVFKLSASSELKLLRSSDNALFVMRGPYEGTLSKFVESCSGPLAPIRRYCRNNTGGDEVPVGGSRGAPRDR